MADIILTEHVIDRYQDRIRPDMLREEAAARLRALTPHAIKLKERTRYGQLRYQLEDCLLVIKEDNGLIAVTVYPLPLLRGQPAPHEWQMAMERIEQHAIIALALEEEPTEERALPPTPAKVEPAKDASATIVRTDTEWQQLLSKEDSVVETAIARLESVVERGRNAAVVHNQRAQKLLKEAERQKQHGQRMKDDRDRMHALLVQVANLIPDSLEARALLPEYLWPRFKQNP